MTRYFFAEILVGSHRVPQETFRAASLSSAKKQATKRKVFHGTVLVIGRALNANGFIIPVAYKRDGKWTEIEDDEEEE